MPKLPDIGALGARPIPQTQRGIDTVRNAGVVQRATQQAAMQDANSAERMGQKISGALEEIAIEEADREFKRLDTEFAKEIQKITYGDGKTPGYYAQKGENALQARADAEKRIAAARKRLAGSASGLARRKFDQASNIRVMRETESINRHTTTQREVANDLVSESAIAQARDDAAASWNDMTKVGQSLRLVADEVQDIGQRKGWAPEVVQQQIEAEQTKIHLAVINNALEVDPMAAEAYYQTNKANIDGTARAAIEKSLEAGVIGAKALKIADAIYAPGKSRTQMYDDAVKASGGDADLAREARREIELRATAFDKDKTAREKAIIEGAEAKVINEGVLPSALSAVEKATLGPAGVARLHEFHKQTIERGSYYKPVMDNDAILAEEELNDLTGSQEGREKLAGMSLLGEGYLRRMTKEQADRWRSVIRGLNSADERAQRAAEKTLTDQAPYNNALSVLKNFAPESYQFGSQAANDKARAKQQKAIRAMTSFVDGFTKEGKRPTRAEVEQEASRIFLDMWADPPGLFNAFEGLAIDADTMTPEQRAIVSVPVDKVPSDLRGEIVYEIRRSGLDVTDSLVSNLAGAYAAKDSARAKRLLGRSIMFTAVEVEQQREQVAGEAGVPVSEVGLIAEALEDAGLPITIENIRRTYDRATDANRKQ